MQAPQHSTGIPKTCMPKEDIGKPAVIGCCTKCCACMMWVATIGIRILGMGAALAFVGTGIMPLINATAVVPAMLIIGKHAGLAALSLILTAHIQSAILGVAALYIKKTC